MIYELAKKDERVIFIGSDLGPGVLKDFRENIPERFIMEGIAEQYIIGMAAGLAFDGFIPYVNTIAAFLTRRCFEQVALDLCLHNLPVRLIGNGGGLVYAPLGPTHQAIEDIGILRTLPNMTIVAPCDAEEMKRLIKASINWPNPMYIRLGKGGDEIVSNPKHGFKIGEGIEIKSTGEILFVSTGITLQNVIKARKILGNEGVDCAIFHVHTLNPFDHNGLIRVSKKSKLVVTVEEHTLTGGLGSCILETFSDHNIPKNVLRIGLPKKFINLYGSQEKLMTEFGLSPESICESVRKHPILSNN